MLVWRPGGQSKLQVKDPRTWGDPHKVGAQVPPAPEPKDPKFLDFFHCIARKAAREGTATMWKHGATRQAWDTFTCHLASPCRVPAVPKQAPASCWHPTGACLLAWDASGFACVASMTVSLVKGETCLNTLCLKRQEETAQGSPPIAPMPCMIGGCSSARRMSSSLLPLQEDHPEDWRGCWAQDPVSKRWTPKFQEYLDDPNTDFSEFELPTETHGAGEAYGEAWRPAGGHVNKAWAVATLGESACQVSLIARPQPHNTEVKFSCNSHRCAGCPMPLATSAPGCSHPA